MLLRVLSAAVEDGWSVRCLCPAGPMVARLREAGVKVRVVPGVEGGEGPLPARIAQLAARSVRVGVLLREARHVHVLLANGLAGLLAVRVARMCRLTGSARVVFYAHDVVRAANRRAYLKIGAPAVDVAFVVSEAVAEPLQAHGIRCELVRNGVPWPVPPAAPPPAPPWVIGAAAVLTPWKGQHVLLEAVAKLGRSDVRLELLGRPFPGDQAYADQLRSRADEPDLAGKVEFLGWRDDALTTLRTWHLVVSPSVEPEASGLSVLEAMSVGLPLVCTDHGGPHEVLGGAGLLVSPGDPDALAAGIARLLDEPELRARCAAAGPVQIADGMTAEAQCAGFTALLESVRLGPPSAHIATPGA